MDQRAIRGMDENDRIQSRARKIVYVLAGLEIVGSFIMTIVSYAGGGEMAAYDGTVFLFMTIFGILAVFIIAAVFAHLDNVGMIRDFMSDVNDRSAASTLREKKELQTLTAILQQLEKLSQDVQELKYGARSKEDK